MKIQLEHTTKSLTIIQQIIDSANINLEIRLLVILLIDRILYLLFISIIVEHDLRTRLHSVLISVIWRP